MSNLSVAIEQGSGSTAKLRKLSGTDQALVLDSDGILTTVDQDTIVLSGQDITAPNVIDGLTAAGSVANDFSGSTGAFKTSTGTNTIGGATNSAFDLTFTVAAKGPVLKQGANGRVGTFTCNGSTPVTVSNTSVAITDFIGISLNAVGGTVGALPAIKTITASTGFTVAGTASDTSTYNYVIVKNAA